MGNEKDNSKKKIYTILGLLFSVVGFIWLYLTSFENNKDRIVFIALFILFIILVSIGAFLGDNNLFWNHKDKKK